MLTGSLHRWVLTVLATAFAAFALAACGGDDGGSGATTVDTGAIPTTATVPEGVPTTAPEGVPTTPEEAQKVAQCLQDAAGDPAKVQACLQQ